MPDGHQHLAWRARMVQPGARRHSEGTDRRDLRIVFLIFMTKTRCAGIRKDHGDGVQVKCWWKLNIWKDRGDGDQVRTGAGGV